ncbi:ImmA/IrrE family metallo-endopeptidase [Streptomyces puniciscabiei]|uniref:ImmA/IrrE family metallo-endopeptidase n=1 Tax=Streptomyces puniciscabiei TaxID=164348 RepID=UPI001F4042EE|nr:ImmA/IrrE family metallo-endopeptidase [Streptomyces puniciscabiei]
MAAVRRRGRAWRKRPADSDLERRIRQVLRDLDVQPPLSVEALCKALGEKRGRPIELRAYPLPKPGPSGLWLETPAADLIIYQQETTKLHQEHIILHEIGHILADHRGEDRVEEWHAVVAGLARSAIRRALGRCNYDDAREQEAELVATVILGWAWALDRVTSCTSTDASVRRLHDTFGAPVGWL